MERKSYLGDRENKKPPIQKDARLQCGASLFSGRAETSSDATFKPRQLSERSAEGLNGIVGAIMGVYAPAIFGESPQVAEKIVLETARTAVGTPELVAEYRFVVRPILIVRQNPRSQSPQIGRLSLGNSVKLLKKEGDFALIFAGQIKRMDRKFKAGSLPVIYANSTEN